MEFIPWCLAAFSIALNLGLAFLLLKPRKTAKRYDATAQDLLHDLTRRGAAILKVEVLDPANLLLRSPRL